MGNDPVARATDALAARFAGYFQLWDSEQLPDSRWRAVLQLNHTRIWQERRHMLRADLNDYATALGLFGRTIGPYRVELTVRSDWQPPGNDKTPGT